MKPLEPVTSTSMVVVCGAVEKVLFISNTYAGSVSAGAKEVIVKALQADFKLEVVETTARDHASELALDAVDRGFHAVLVFGGDGTINEAAQGLVASDVALGILPGGSTNVMARSLGIPRDPVEATAFGAERLRSGTTRRIHVGQLGHRYFLFSAGMGLDAEVVKRVEMDPVAKRERGEWSFFTNALKAAFTQYRGMDPSITLTVEGTEPARVVLAVCCNGRPFTYFKQFQVDALPQARLDGGLDFLGLMRIRSVTIPHIAWSFFVSRSHPRWRSSVYHHDVTTGSMVADRPMPVQVDGDYIGELTEARIELVRDALSIAVL
jgi:diacylglycerol kinase family enzyme